MSDLVVQTTKNLDLPSGAAQNIHFLYATAKMDVHWITRCIHFRNKHHPAIMKAPDTWERLILNMRPTENACRIDR
jgi:hypothetical protein